ncbi:MAG TPA: hypothetical protein VG476_02785, partial [Acidimicrobiales bacterium]|nr:hypothetical protein [Acidimicrobiales bacterium]
MGDGFESPLLYDDEESSRPGVIDTDDVEDPEDAHYGEGTGEVIEGSTEQPHFARAIRGYDRDQVDTYVAEYARWGSAALARIAELEAKVTELEAVAATSRERRAEADDLIRRAEMAQAEAEERATAMVDAAEARVGELATKSDRDRDAAAELFQQAEMARAEAEAARAEADEVRAEGERRAAKMIEEAHAKAAEIVAACDGQGDEAAQLMRQAAEAKSDAERWASELVKEAEAKA